MGLLLLVGLVHGLIYVFLIPPWQHFDEPGHFEYAWLLANRDGRPAAGSYDPVMRRELAASMSEHNFFRGFDVQLNLISIHEPAWIGVAQTGDYPLYYLLVAAPLRLIKGTELTFQLYAGRLVSLFLFLTVITAAYGIMAELTPEKHPLRWMTPAAAALFPAFTDLMTAVNNDVGAAAFFSLFLWACISLIQRGFRWSLLGAAALLALLSFFTKSTAAVAVFLLPVSVLFSIFKGRKLRIAWGAFVLACLLLFAVIFQFDEALYWYRDSAHREAARVKTGQAPHSPYAFRLVQRPQTKVKQIRQIVPAAALEHLQGEPFTLAAWIWASEPVEAQVLTLRKQGNTFSQSFKIGTEPAFYAFSGMMPEGYSSAEVILSRPGAVQKEIHLYYDNILLVKGNLPLDEEPVFLNGRGQEGEWGGIRFTNIVRNPSANAAWIRIRPALETRLDSIFPDQSSFVLASVADFQVSGWYYRSTGQTLFRTFWGMFGWGHVPLIGAKPYRVLGWITLFGLAGAGLYAARRWRELPYAALLLLALTLVLVWGSTLVRGISSLSGAVFIPSARYTYPAFIATILPLVVGWRELTIQAGKLLKLPGRILPALYISTLLGFALFALYSILRYYWA